MIIFWKTSKSRDFEIWHPSWKLVSIEEELLVSSSSELRKMSLMRPKCSYFLPDLFSLSKWQLLNFFHGLMQQNFLEEMMLLWLRCRISFPIGEEETRKFMKTFVDFLFSSSIENRFQPPPMQDMNFRSFAKSHLLFVFLSHGNSAARSHEKAKSEENN